MTVLHSQLNDLTREQLIARVQSMQAASQRKLTLKVGAKGGISLYGVGRFPVTLYATQWERVLGEADAIRAFIAANSELLARKD